MGVQFDFSNSKNGHSPESDPIPGRFLAHARLTASRRAGLAAQLVLNELRLFKPTIRQATAITHVSPAYAQLALRMQPATRAKVAWGQLNLIQASKMNGLFEAWLTASPDEKAAFGVAVGVNEVWDEAIAPSI
jgi:hypothetical protein